MSNSFSRRDFLRAGAAAAVLGGMSVLLTDHGHDHSDPDFHELQPGETFTFQSGLKLSPGMIFSSFLSLEVIAGESDITLYPDALSASSREIRPCLGFAPLGASASVCSGTRNILSALHLKHGSSAFLKVLFDIPDDDTDYYTFEFNHNEESIKFKCVPSEEEGTHLLTTGIYTENF